MPTYVIEHMESDESDGSFPPWVSLEYSQMLHLASPSQVIFSSLSPQSVSSLGGLLESRGASRASYRAETSSILELMKAEGVDLSKVCLLDPKAQKEVSVEDREEFDWFLFGGILGDDPPRDRTGELRKLGFPTRHLGPVQMTTDTALGVTKIVVQDQIPLDKIPFVNHPTIRFDEIESVEMPFRYVADAQGEPILPKGMRELLREDMDKGFDNFDDDEEPSK
ncbi:BZ3500_MvSof-1268-A1-R1_Chr2-1g04290 [Microbotryum saponariae]|uniref:BZ3500_MvSof-1268-A1-R1_Chr2-1g04290 protein n=1 Tax=Microbotryum saponariae TaxID=289078 RepID=A0A2X0KFQ8_9BASI|nr:BZ3500_MvSof-1268-A1-R1_Chr2-1g04290 [Microbotryum saponariae]SCZ91337.1 BZ3501_MvSof-1269-A2-R1_Chr2-1g03946 [Microbotryum saponariae]